MSNTNVENDKAGKPKLVVELSDASHMAESETPSGEARVDAADGQTSRGGRWREHARGHKKRGERRERLTRSDLEDAVGLLQGMGAVAWNYAERHPYTVGYGFVGLVLAVLVLSIGLWSTIIIAVFMLVGALLGQIRDGENDLVNFFSRLFDRRS